MRAKTHWLKVGTCGAGVLASLLFTWFYGSAEGRNPAQGYTVAVTGGFLLLWLLLFVWIRNDRTSLRLAAGYWVFLVLYLPWMLELVMGTVVWGAAFFMMSWLLLILFRKQVDWRFLLRGAVLWAAISGGTLLHGASALYWVLLCGQPDGGREEKKRARRMIAGQ